jgi:hypothetical protein
VTGQHLIIVRSSDTGLGQLADPTGTWHLTEDGRLRWVAVVQREIVLEAMALDPSVPLRVPTSIPEITSKLALLVREAGTWNEHERLRAVLGDHTVQPFARYLQAETGGAGPSPVALGHHPDPASWPDLDWRLKGRSVGLLVCVDGELCFAGGDSTSELQVVVRTIGDHLAAWLREFDPSTEGPSRGLRRPREVVVHSSMLQFVGRSDVTAHERPRTESVSKRKAGELGGLLEEVLMVPPSLLAPAAKVSPRALRRYRNGERSPGHAEIARLANAVADAPVRRCLGCGRPVTGRSDKVWCSAACRMRTTRSRAEAPNDAAAVEPFEVDAALETLLARVDGLTSLGGAALHASPKLRPAIADALATGMSVDELVTVVAAGGPVSSAKNPIGALVARVRGVAEFHAADIERRTAGSEVRDVDLEHRLAALVSAGAISEAEAAAERRAHAQDNDTQGANR